MAAFMQPPIVADVSHRNGRNNSLSRSAGDNGVISLTAPSRQAIVQPRLELTTPGDRYEQEAYRMADFVMRKAFSDGNGMPSEHPSRTSALPPVISRQTDGVTSGIAIDPATESGINASRGGGQPLPVELRTKMESGFNADFSGVRLHTDSQATDLSNTLQAKAFTYGNDIFFNSGQYNPQSTAGQHLIAHELTHVVQQSGKLTRQPQHNSTNGAAPVKSKEGDDIKAVLDVASISLNIISILENRKLSKKLHFLIDLLNTIGTIAQKEVGVMRSTNDVVSMTIKHEARVASKLDRFLGWAGLALALLEFCNTLKTLNFEDHPKASGVLLGLQIMSLASSISTQPSLLAKIAAVNPTAAVVAVSLSGGFAIGDTINFLSEKAFGKTPGEAVVDAFMTDYNTIPRDDIINHSEYCLSRIRGAVYDVKQKLTAEENNDYTLNIGGDKIRAFWEGYRHAVVNGKERFLFIPSTAESFLNSFFHYGATIMANGIILTKVDIKCLKEAFNRLGLY